MTEVLFIREKKERDFTVINNTCLKDQRLSWKAKGLFCYILSLPEDWQIHLSEIENHATDGRDSLRTAVKELKDYGYLQAKQLKNPDGTFSATLFKVIEKPQNSPRTENPSTENPSTENPQTENPKLQNTDIKNYLKKQKTNETKENARARARDEAPLPRDYAKELREKKDHEKKSVDFMEKLFELRDNYVKNGLNGRPVSVYDFNRARNIAQDIKGKGDTRDFIEILNEELLKMKGNDQKTPALF